VRRLQLARHGLGPWKKGRISMKSLRLGLAALPLLAGVAWAAEPLSDAQLDAVTAGFSAVSIADAQASGKVVATVTATLAEVGPVTTGDPVTISFGQTAAAPLSSLPAGQWASTIVTSLGSPFSP
jgi:hypothetical protein